MNRIKTCVLVSVLLTAVQLPSGAQLLNFNTESDRWRPGKVLLHDGSVLKGSVNYNFITGLLSLEDEQGVQTFMANKASYFDWKETDGKLIKHYSLPYAQRKGKAPQYLFFEVVHENNSLAILSRHVYDYKVRGTGGGRSDVPNKEDRTIEIEKVSEQLYLATEDGQLLSFASRKKDKSSTFVYDTENELKQNKYGNSSTYRNARDQYKITNSDFYKIIGGENYEQMVSDCETERVQLDTLYGLIYYMDFCEENKTP